MKFYLKDIRQVVYMSSKNKDLKYNDMQYVIMFHHTSSLLRLPITQNSWRTTYDRNIFLKISKHSDIYCVCIFICKFFNIYKFHLL